jgi:hypothetical protein
MIIIRDIAWVEVDRDTYYVARCDMPPRRVPITGGSDPERDFIDVEVVTEAIQGNHFIRHDGESVYMGFSNRASEALGMQNEAFRDMRSSMAMISGEHAGLSCRLGRIQSANLWQRIKWVFNGCSI